MTVTPEVLYDLHVRRLILNVLDGSGGAISERYDDIGRSSAVRLDGGKASVTERKGT